MQATAGTRRRCQGCPEDSRLSQLEDGIAWFRKGDTEKAAEIIQSVLAAQSATTRVRRMYSVESIFTARTFLPLRSPTSMAAAAATTIS